MENQENLKNMLQKFGKVDGIHKQFPEVFWPNEASGSHVEHIIHEVN